MVAKVILNPYSARWRAEKRFPEAARALEEVGLAFEVARSEGRGHCTALAEEAVREGFSPIIVAGGDGTIGEVVNGMMNASADDEDLPPLGILPLGTANDLVFNLKMSTDFQDMAKVIAAGKTRALDLCKVNDRYFVNNTALGLEPLVTLTQEKITLVKGTPRYLMAALSAIFSGTSWDAKLTWDDGSYEGPISLISVGNGACTGGLFYVVPHADPFDGRITFTFGYAKSRLRMLTILPAMMKPGQGNYVEMDEISEFHTTHLHVKLLQSSPSHADGEIFDRALYEADYRIEPQRLPVLMP